MLRSLRQAEALKKTGQDVIDGGATRASETVRAVSSVQERD